MSKTPHILSIDLGTSGPKVALVSSDGSIAAATSRRIATVQTPDGGAEQDPHEIWATVSDACREVVSRGEVSADRIVGISLVSQYFSVVPVDANGLPVGNLLLWMDTRGAPYALELLGKDDAFAQWIERHGMIPLPSGADSLSKMLWLQRERPEIYERTHKFLEPMDYLAARFSGRCTANACTAYALLLASHRHPNEAAWDETLIGLSGIDPAKLPEMVAIGADLGPIRPDVAEELGLSATTRVYSGINDTQAVSLGAGTGTRGVGGVNIGTTGQVLAHTDERRSDFDNGIVSASSPVPNRYMVLAENGLAGGALDHLVRNIFCTTDSFASHEMSDPFAGLDASISGSVAGSRGLLFLPWMTGAAAPESESSMRGGFLNFSLQTTRADMLRSVLEGIAFGFRWLLPAVEELAGAEFESLRFAGGGAVSPEWAQIIASVTGRPVNQLADPRHVINRASAYTAFCARGEAAIGDLERFCPARQVFEPNRDNTGVYDRMFEQFVKSFEQTRPIFSALNG